LDFEFAVVAGGDDEVVGRLEEQVFRAWKSIDCRQELRFSRGFVIAVGGGSVDGRSLAGCGIDFDVGPVIACCCASGWVMWKSRFGFEA